MTGGQGSAWAAGQGGWAPRSIGSVPSKRKSRGLDEHTLGAPLHHYRHILLVQQPQGETVQGEGTDSTL